MRFEERGLIKRGKTHCRVTRKGKVFLSRYWKRSYQRSAKDDTRWDGKWRLISFDVPISDDKKRKILRDSLRELNFYQLHKSVWIAPYKMTKEFWKFVVLNELHKYCKIMLIEVLEGDEELKKHFGLS